MKKIIILIAVLVIILSLGASNTFAAGGPIVEDNIKNSQRIFTQNFNTMINPIKVEIVKWPDYQVAPGEEILIICRAKNYSPLIEEVTYNLSSNRGLGGIEAVIDYDGPFGSKNPESYNWHKVPIRPGEEQYLYISFPPPAIYEKEFNYTITVDRWLGPRG